LLGVFIITTLMYNVKPEAITNDIDKTKIKALTGDIDKAKIKAVTANND